MRKIHIIIYTIILLYMAACQQNPSDQEILPTLLVLPSVTSTPVPRPTLPPTFTPTDTATATPTRTASPTPTITPTATRTPIIIPTLVPTVTPLALPEMFQFGQSLEGRPLIARRFGEGNTLLMLVGGIHGGYESNTSQLMEEFIIYFETLPETVLPGASLLIIPALNPDGVMKPDTLVGRFNANGVDLNRNWGCNWQETAYFYEQEVYPGAEPFSEPESRALAALINDLRPAVVLFYHSAADGVFAGHCDGNTHSEEMAAVFGSASGYPYQSDFTKYDVTGPRRAGSMGWESPPLMWNSPAPIALNSNVIYRV